MNKFTYISISTYLFCLSTTNGFLQAPAKFAATTGGRIIESKRFMFDFLKPKEPENEPEEPVVEENKEAYSSDDPVEKIFGFFFGAKEEEPMGMKRFGKERFPEQYPAVLDEWAEPFDGDSPEVAALRPMLKNTNLEFRGLKVREFCTHHNIFQKTKTKKKLTEFVFPLLLAYIFRK